MLALLFLAVASMIARQLPLFVGRQVISLEWAAYFAALLAFPGLVAGGVPFCAILGLQLLRSWLDRGLGREYRLLSLRRAVREGGLAGIAAALAAGGARGRDDLLLAGWPGMAAEVLGAWLLWVVLLSLLGGLDGTIRYRVNPAREAGRQLAELGWSWVVALPAGALAYLVLARYGTGMVLGAVLLLLAVLLLYTLLVFADMQGAYWGTIHALVRTLESKERLSPGGAQRGACLAAALARKLHLGERQVYQVYLGALLRDIGLVGMDERLVAAARVLSEEERATLARHAVIGGKILASLPRMRGVAVAIRHHHERWDGTGYPEGLRGTEIPLEARIVALADAYVAMTSDRPFRRALSGREARAELVKGAGKQFDPRLVPRFLRVASEEENWGNDAFHRRYTLLPGG